MANKLLTVLKNPLKFRLFLITRLPMAYLAGLKVEEVDEQHSVISINYKYLTQNPFRSIYFACLAMAGELASGALAMLHISAEATPVSMLVTYMEADFTKKAVGKIKFHCNDGVQIARAIQEAKTTGEGRTVVACSTGLDEAGDKVAEFRITWSFKAKK